MPDKERRMNDAIVPLRTPVCDAAMRSAGRTIALSAYGGCREPSYNNASRLAAGQAKELGTL